MPRALWPLRHDQPVVRIRLALGAGGRPVARHLLADTGAGTSRAGFELLLMENDCLSCGGIPSLAVVLGGAYVGTFPTYLVRVRVPEVGFDHYVQAVGLRTGPGGFDGIAGFRFLNRFTYGNFGDPDQFGIEN